MLVISVILTEIPRLTKSEKVGIPAIMDFPTSMAPMRGYVTTASQVADGHDARMRDFLSASSAEDSNLDPVSALLRAGEIVNRTSRDRSSS